ncbi:MAG: methylmalonyl Co-A mutase-associated GTPase MeaB [Pseudomonadota bacterium]
MEQTVDSPLAALDDKAALARALAQLERFPERADTLALLDAAYQAPRAQVIGLTGPPGVGKSSLLGALIRHLRARGERLGVIAVDPSSRRSGGALLGDRLRLKGDPEDPGLFVRSMAARDRLGGLAELTVAAMVVMRAVFDRVLIETVGVGQSETDVAGVADTVVFCVQPASGDSLQFMKAGIVEIPDIAVVTKADLGTPAKHALSDLRSALGLTAAGRDWPVAVQSLSVQAGQGLEGLVEKLDKHWDFLCQGDRLTRLRQTQADDWLGQGLRERYGREGEKRLGPVTLAPGQSPFAKLAALG